MCKVELAAAAVDDGAYRLEQGPSLGEGEALVGDGLAQQVDVPVAGEALRPLMLASLDDRESTRGAELRVRRPSGAGRAAFGSRAARPGACAAYANSISARRSAAITG